MSKTMKAVLFTIGLAILWAFCMALANAAEGYKPTDLQMLHLLLKQKDAQLAQQNVFIAQRELQSAMAALSAEAEKVKQENNWPASVKLNPETLVFSEPTKQENSK